MKLFDDDFIKFEEGPLHGRMMILSKQSRANQAWPPPAIIVHQGEFTYERVSMSEITDEQRERMTHVARGALYRLREGDGTQPTSIERQTQEVPSLDSITDEPSSRDQQNEERRQVMNGDVTDEQADIVGEIMDERERQDAKWGGPEHDDHHNGRDWTTLIGIRLAFDYSRDNLIEAAVLLVAWIESRDRLTALEVAEGRAPGTYAK